jgi:hypothetical protein
MLSVKDLRTMAATLPAADFIKQLGPFVLIQKPPGEATSKMALKLAAGKTMLADRLPSSGGLSLLLQFDELDVATLPPLAENDSLTVGRLPDCDIVIDDPSVSKRHAMVRWDHERHRCTIKDLESMNGTLINGAVIQKETALRDTDLIACGDAQFLFLQTETLFVKLKAHRARR